MYALLGKGALVTLSLHCTNIKRSENLNSLTWIVHENLSQFFLPQNV